MTTQERLKAQDPQPVSTRQRLIDAARSLMIERQSLDVSLSEITKRAKANVALVSYYFEGREGLMLEITRDDATEALGQLSQLTRSDLSPREKLRRHIIGVVEVFFAKPYLNRLLHMLMREGSREAALAVTSFFVVPLTIAREKIIEDGIAAGEFRQVNPKLISFAIDGACEHIFASQEARAAVLGQPLVDRKLCDEHARLIAELFVDGLSPRD